MRSYYMGGTGSRSDRGMAPRFGVNPPLSSLSIVQIQDTIGASEVLATKFLLASTSKYLGRRNPIFGAGGGNVQDVCFQASLR